MARVFSWIKILIFFLSVSSLSACGKKEYSNQSYVIGHGGMGVASTYPMNSIESFLKALNLNADGVEIDVQMSSDGVLVAYHDEFLNDRSTGKGKIEEAQWEYIRQLFYTNYPYLSYSIRSVEEVLHQIQHKNPIVILDIKSIYEYSETKHLVFQAAISELIQNYSASMEIIIESKEAQWLADLKNNFPEIITLLYGYEYENAIAQAENYQLDGIALDLKEFKLIPTDSIQKSSLLLSAFNVHTKVDHQLALKMHIDYIQTENINYLLRLLRRN